MIYKILKLSVISMLLLNSSSPLDYPEVEASNMYLYVGYSEQLTIEEFTNRFFTISDNKTPREKLKIEYVPELKLSWPINSYSCIYVTDEDGNSSSMNFLYYVTDDLAPEIYGPNILTFHYDENVSLEEILSYYSAHDEVDGKSEIVTNDTYQNKSTNILLQAYDKVGNVGNKLIQIDVLETPSFWYVETTLDLDNLTYYSAEEIVNLLMEKQLLEKFEYLYACYQNNIYETNYHISGLYEEKIDIYVINESIPRTINIKLNVLSSNQTIEEEKEEFWWDSFLLFIKKLFQRIIDFFTF